MYIQRMPRESTLEVVLKRADFDKRAVWVVQAQVDKRRAPVSRWSSRFYCYFFLFFFFKVLALAL